MPVTQFNMKYVEQTGLVKFDFLGLKTMTVIQKAVDLVNATRADGAEELDILKVPLDDAKTLQIMADGKTVGVFQLESAGMRDTGRQMKISNFEQIIALVALYRPGPMDNIPKYLSCLHGQTERDYMHPLLKPYLEETYGIIVYQEQVMQAAQALAGYTLGGADLLRRAMGKKIPAEMAAQRQIFVDGAVKHNGLEPERASDIFDQIDKFAGYGFNKSHAAAYALIAYWTGWLKANYPVQFMAASMTLDLQNTDKLAIFKQELDRMRIKLQPPDINQSNPDFKVEGKAIRYALAALKGVGEQAMVKVVTERTAHGPYKTLYDLATRIEPGSMNKRQFEHLAGAGAFDSLNANRAQCHGSAEILLRYAQSQAEERNSGQNSLFGGTQAVALAEPPLAALEDWDTLERLQREFEAVGFYLSAHPLDARAGQLERLKILSAAQVETMLTHQPMLVTDMAGVLLKKQIKVSPKSGNKYAFLQMSDGSGVYEAMLFSEVLHRAKDYLNEGESLLLKTVAERKNDQTRYSVQDIQPLEKALAGKVREIRFTLTGPEGLSQLKTLLDTEGQGPAKIYVEIAMDEGVTAELELPGRWSLSPEARNALIRSGAVTDVREF
jgi:DNA polymerase-3 subunit alpha